MDTTPKNYLALGDSYTIGESVAASDRFPVQIVKLLRDKGVSINDAEIIATTGWTTRDLLYALQVLPPLPVYDIVSLLIGVNNQYQGKSIETYRKEFLELFHRSVQFAGGNPCQVIVLSIPDYSVTPFSSQSETRRIANEIDNFNEVNKAITLSGGAHYIDITGITREAANKHSFIANDGLHPSALQYERWTWLLGEKIYSIFQNEK